MRERGLVAGAAACGLALTGCGGGASQEPARDAMRLAPPPPPPEAACATGELATERKPDRALVPAPGRYRYRAAGSRTLSGAETRRTPIAREIEVVATPATRAGRLLCFRVQRRYSASLGETATLVVRGPWLYLTELVVHAGAQRSAIRPRPPVLAVAAGELEWRGTFGGPTRGRYSARVLGRRTLIVDGERRRAVGVEFSMAASGRVNGAERSVRWFGVDGGPVLAERTSQRRRLGLDRVSLDTDARLLSLEPRSR